MVADDATPSSKTAHFEDGKPKKDLPSSIMAPNEDGKGEVGIGFGRASILFLRADNNSLFISDK